MTKKKNSIFKTTSTQEEFIIEHLRHEWDGAQKAAKKHELIQAAKTAGINAGKWLLTAGLVIGVMTIAAAAPNVFAAFGSIAKGGNRRSYINSVDFSRVLQSGSSKHYWKYKQVAAGKYNIELTKAGRAAAIRQSLRDFKLGSRKRAWDSKWRIVMFDIPKKQSSMRDGLRRKLSEIGLYPIQESVFVYPYPCFDEVMLWVELFGLRDGVEIFQGEFLTDMPKRVVEYFDLA